MRSQFDEAFHLFSEARGRERKRKRESEGEKKLQPHTPLFHPPTKLSLGDTAAGAEGTGTDITVAEAATADAAAAAAN